VSQIAIEQVHVTTTGADGAATGSASSIPIQGFLLDVYINFHASAPATTDVTIADPTFGNILVKSNSLTDVWLAPRKQTCDAAAADTGLYDLIPLNSALTISVAQADALTDCVVVTLRWMTP
jgi:hypothetical protein